MSQKMISMTREELSRYDIIQNLINRAIKADDAAKQTNLSIRQVQRIKKEVIIRGVEGVIHKNRGRESNNKINYQEIKKIKDLLKNKYSFCGPSFAQEKLEEIHQIKVGKETIRQIMITIGIWTPKPRKQCKNKYKYRARKDSYGEMQQFDGCYHIWFGDKEYCLLLSVDDATGKITYAIFDVNEGVIAVFNFWLDYFKKHGLPLAIYLDKFSTYKINHKNAVDNKDLMTQFQRAMKQLGVQVINANSPQAKGRVERMNRTLQDRLVNELRLANISDIDSANIFLKEYIDEFNRKFAVVPKNKANLHKKIDKITKGKLNQILSIQNTRIINNDYTVRFKNNYYQLDEIQPTTVYKKDEVIIEEHLNGDVKIRIREKYLNYFILPEKPQKEIDIKLVALTKQKQFSYKPPADHPWRKQFVFKKEQKIFAQK